MASEIRPKTPKMRCPAQYQHDCRGGVINLADEMAGHHRQDAKGKGKDIGRSYSTNSMIAKAAPNRPELPPKLQSTRGCKQSTDAAPLMARQPHHRDGGAYVYPDNSLLGIGQVA